MRKLALRGVNRQKLMNRFFFPYRNKLESILVGFLKEIAPDTRQTVVDLATSTYLAAIKIFSVALHQFRSKIFFFIN